MASGSNLSGSRDTEDEKGGGLCGFTGSEGGVAAGLGVGEGASAVGRISLRCSWRLMAFGSLEELVKRILDPTASIT